MQPQPNAFYELACAVNTACDRMTRFRAQPEHVQRCPLEQRDHRAAVAGDLCEAIDRAWPGQRMGALLMQAMFPELDLAMGDPDSELQQALAWIQQHAPGRGPDGQALLA